jgi:hypothetical protein
MDDWA